MLWSIIAHKGCSVKDLAAMILILDVRFALIFFPDDGKLIGTQRRHLTRRSR
jgi:hypothetical protein